MPSAEAPGDSLSSVEVIPRRDLDVVRLAFDHGDVAARPFDDGGGIGADESLTGRLVVRLEQPGRLEGLRCLHSPKVLGITGYPTIGDVHDAPGKRQARNTANRAIGLGQQSLDQAMARKRAYRVVHQDLFDLFSVDPGSERLETGKFGTMPHVAASDDHAELGESFLQAFARAKV